MGAGVVEHGSPTGCGGGDAEAEEGQRGFSEDDAGHADGGLNHDGLDDVGEDVAEEDAEWACAQCSGGVDVFTVADGHDLGADEARIAGPSTDGEGEDEVGEAWAEEGGEGDGEEDAGEGEEGVHGEGGEDGVDPAAEVACEAANGEAEGEGDGDDADGDGEGEARAPEEAGEGVAAELVGSGPVGGGRGLEAVEQVDGGGIVGCEPRGG